MGQHEIVEGFTTTQEKLFMLQSAVAKGLKDECAAVKHPRRSCPLFINIWNDITTFLVISILLSTLVPLAWQVVVRMFGENLLLDYKYPISGLILILFIGGRPSVILFRYFIKKYPRMKSLFRFLGSIVISLEIAVIHEWLDYLLKNKFSNHIYNDFFIILFLSILIAFIITSSRSLAPDFLTLLASNRIDIEPKSLSYRSIAGKVIKDTYKHTQHWSASAVQEVRTHCQKRSVYLSTQAQTISPALGALALFSLLALFLPPGQIESIVKFFDSILSTFSNSPDKVSSAVLILTGIVLIAVRGCIYFINLYWSQCVLEIIDTLCLMRIEECESERKDIEEQPSSSRPLSILQIFIGILQSYFRQLSLESSEHKRKY